METGLLSGLSPDQQRLVVAKMTRRAFRKGDTLFHEGDPGDSLHVLLKGRVAVQTTSRNGDVATLSVLGPGACFGELALLSPTARRSASVVALEATETRTLHRDDFVDLCQRHPSVEHFLVEVLAAQVQKLSAQVLEGLFMPAEIRVARRLLDLAAVYADGATAGPIDVPVRQDDIASMAGTTRPTTNRALKQLEEAGVIQVARGRFVVLDLDALQRRAR